MLRYLPTLVVTIMSLTNEHPQKSPIAEADLLFSGKKMKPLHLAGYGVIVNLSKQIALAMTCPLYTKPIERRKPIEFINALVFLKRLSGLLIAPYVQRKTASGFVRVMLRADIQSLPDV